jgi:uncharacterized iron-regulated membrane protein
LPHPDPVEPGVTEIERTYDPVTGTATVIRREGRSNTGWWVTGLVLVVAIIATAVVLASRGPAATNAATAAAVAQGSAQTAAQDAQNAAALAQSNAQASVEATQAAAADAAVSRAQAAAAAARAADRASDIAGQQPQDSVPPPRTLPPANDNPQQ